MKRKYSDLVNNSLGSTKNFLFTSEEESTIVKIFNVVTSEKFTITEKSNNEMGGRFIIEGKSNQSHEVINHRKPLAPFEFLLLLDELNDIIKNYRFDSILILCDELNHFPKQTNIEILRNYFNTFHSKKIQFFIVVVNPDTLQLDDANLLFDSFDNKLKIETFNNSEAVWELIQNSTHSINQKVFFENGIIDYLFEVTKGHPWWIQKICDDAFVISSKNDFVINMEIIENSFNKFSKEIFIYNKITEQGLPFRKTHLFL